MAVLIDTNVAILLRDREPLALRRIGDLSGDAIISVVTHVELEGGVYRDLRLAATRRASLDILLATLVVVPFADEEVAAYARIVAASTYSRPRLLDRMIAATALVHDLRLITVNGADFRDIPGLKLEVWPDPCRN